MKYALIVIFLISTISLSKADEIKVEDTKITLSLSELNLIIKSQAQLGIAQYLAQKDLEIVANQLPKTNNNKKEQK